MAGCYALLCSTTLYDAAEKGDLRRVKKYVQKGENLNIRAEFGLTPLHIAALNGRVEVLRCYHLRAR